MNVDFDCPIKLPSLSLANTVVTPHLLEVVRDGGLERLDLSFQVVTSNVEPKPLPSEQVCRLEEFDRLFLDELVASRTRLVVFNSPSNW